MSAATTSPQSSWSLIVNALAELGAREIERRERAAQQPPADDTRRDDDQQHDETQSIEAA